MASALTAEQAPGDLMERVNRCLFPVRLQEARPSTSKQYEQAALRALEAAMSAACHGCNATEIQQSLSDLALALLSLDDEGMTGVDSANCRIVSLVTDLATPAVRHSLDYLFADFHQSVAEAKQTLRPVRDEVTGIIASMAEARSVEPSSLTFAFPAVLQVCPPRHVALFLQLPLQWCLGVHDSVVLEPSRPCCYVLLCVSSKPCFTSRRGETCTWVH